jgi:hypothetical protein
MTVFPLRCPFADPEMVRELPQMAVNVPAIEFPVCDAI